MTKLRIEGGKPLFGTISIDGAKNAVLPILAGCILTHGRTVLHTVPKISDIMNMLKILSRLGCIITVQNDTVSIDADNITGTEIPEDLAGKIRGSIFIMGAVLSRTGKIKLPFPGGCAIGARPIDIHISALTKMGIRIKQTKRHIECSRRLTATDTERNRTASPAQPTGRTEPQPHTEHTKLHTERRRNAKEQRTKTIYLDFPSVGATENIILTAALGVGTYKIVNAAAEPEVADLCNFLNACGAGISGIGTNEITIRAAERLHGTEYTPIPDRINTGSYLIAVAAAGGSVTLKNVMFEHNANLIDKLRTLGAKITTAPGTIHISYTRSAEPKRHNFNIHTAPYPGFPTDLQSQFAALAATIPGRTVITENLFENRFRYAAELRKLGAKITVAGSSAEITGGAELSAAAAPHICPIAYTKNPTPVCDGTALAAADLRGGVALVIAGLAAKGTATVTNAEYIYRGHSDIVRDLTNVGANIIKIEEPGNP